ncbi:hypothetical protein Q7P37_001710 [Cladosporium fusiforme]
MAIPASIRPSDLARRYDCDNGKLASSQSLQPSPTADTCTSTTPAAWTSRLHDTRLRRASRAVSPAAGCQGHSRCFKPSSFGTTALPPVAWRQCDAVPRAVAVGEWAALVAFGGVRLLYGAATNLVSCARSAHHPAEPNYRSHMKPFPCLSCRPVTATSAVTWATWHDDAGSPVVYCNSTDERALVGVGAHQISAPALAARSLDQCFGARRLGGIACHGRSIPFTPQSYTSSTQAPTLRLPMCTAGWPAPHPALPPRLSCNCGAFCTCVERSLLPSGRHKPPARAPAGTTVWPILSHSHLPGTFLLQNSRSPQNR